MSPKIKNLLLLLLILPFILWSEPESEHLIFGITSDSDFILNKKGFSLGYSQKYKQAIWICYILQAENLKKEQVKRKNKFKKDPEIKRKAVKPEDYNRTGYDRGHLAPAADMTYSELTEQESFYMTNMSPQLPGCNRGIWKRVEAQVRKWALQEDKICVITGPIFAKRNKRMGSAKIAVPIAFYKVILDLTPPRKMIAFIIPNEPSKKRIQSFVVPVNQVEYITGFHFFSELLEHPDYLLKSIANYSDWKK